MRANVTLCAEETRFCIGAAAVVAAAVAVVDSRAADASTSGVAAEDYGQYSLMFERSAGQYFAGQTCITQFEQWWDDNRHPYSLQLARTVEIARGLGMAFTNHTTVPLP